MPLNRDLAVRGHSGSYSPAITFNHWNGQSSFDGFDDFYGVDNFSGSHFTQTIVQDKELVCHTQQITIIQQRLLVIKELAKRIISEQICSVETQTVVFEQFHASLGSFRGDLRHVSGNHVGYDSHIASHFGDIFGSDGSFSTSDFGFTGHDLGSSTVTVGGSNWNDATSFESVNSAYLTSRHAHSDFSRNDF
ncbi:hypothetical protein C8J56DRAFT_780192 [Mycena floridula]|nr:hypothetical protein C8J56DRAFT_780192 [Mycena floridula]